MQGKSLITKKNFNEGDVLFEERPLVSSQFLWNEFYKYEACEYCLCSLETAENQSRRLTENPALTLPHPECDVTDPSTYVKCPQCQVWGKYCSICLRVIPKNTNNSTTAWNVIKLCKLLGHNL